MKQRMNACVGGVARLLVSTIACVLLTPAIPSAASGDAIEEIAIRLQLAGGYVGAETLAQLEEALLETAEAALIGQLGGDIDTIRQHQNAVVESLGGVIDEALARRGFALEELELELGRMTLLTVRLNLAEQRVQDFAVSFYMLGNTPIIKALTANSEEAIAGALYATVARTPYRDEYWLSNLIKDTVEQQLAQMIDLAEFQHIVLVQPGETAKVAVTMVPRDDVPVLTAYKLHLRSLTLPNFSLAPVRDEMVFHLRSLLGAPLSYIDVHLDDLQQAFYQQLVNDCALSDHCAEARLNLALNGCTLTVDSAIDSQRYMFNARARLALWDLSAGDWEGRFTLRAGIQPAPGWTVFGLASYYPGEGELFPAATVGYLVDYGLLAIGYDFEVDAARVYGEYYLSPQAYITTDLLLDTDYDRQSEIALHFRVRDIYELQLVSNLEGEVYAALAASF